MRRIFFRALNPPLLMLLLAIGIAIQSAFFTFYPVRIFKPDLVLILVVWAGLRRSFEEGGVLTLISAEIAELHSSAPQGLFLVTYLLVYLAVRGSAQIFVLPDRKALMVFTIALAVLWKVLYLVVLALLGLAGRQWQHALLYLVPTALATGVFSYWIYRALEKFDWGTFKNAKAHQRLEDELILDEVP